MEAILSSLAGAAVGATLTQLYNRFSDRANPLASILRIGYAPTVPSAAKDALASFPPTLASRINGHPTIPATVDSATDIPLREYSEQVRVIRETVRMVLGRQERALTELFPPFFAALDRNEALECARIFAENTAFLWAWIRGRTRRDQVPPDIPDHVVDLQSIHPRDGLIVRSDKDGDYILDLQGSVYRVYLIWSTIKVPDQAHLCQKAASALVRDIAEFRTDSLRTIIGVVQRDVEESVTELRALLSEISDEEKRVSFLETVALMRNRGRQPYCIDSTARLFVSAAGYSFQSSKGAAQVDHDVEINVFTDHLEPALTVILPREVKIVRFVTNVPFPQLPDYEVLAALGRAGERKCSLALRLFTERAGSVIYHTSPVPFRTFDATAAIPRPRRSKWLPNKGMKLSARP
jgi:hypothetical protein